MSNTKDLLNTIPQTGKIEWISIRPEKRGAVQALDMVQAITDLGLEGDHYGKAGGNRQVTFVQAEHLPVVAAIAGKESVHPSATRRNIVVSGINLLSLKDQRVQIGEAVLLEVTGPCPPCSRMEETIGKGGFQAMRGHGGITAKVLQGGTIRVGDQVKAVPVMENVA